MELVHEVLLRVSYNYDDRNIFESSQYMVFVTGLYMSMYMSKLLSVIFILSSAGGCELCVLCVVCVCVLCVCVCVK